MFESIESTLYPIVCDINTYLSNYILVFLLIGVGLWYSIKTRFVQLRCFKEGWNSVFGNLMELDCTMQPKSREAAASKPPKIHRAAALLQRGLEQRVRQPVAARQEA